MRDGRESYTKATRKRGKLTVGVHRIGAYDMNIERTRLTCCVAYHSSLRISLCGGRDGGGLGGRGGGMMNRGIMRSACLELHLSLILIVRQRNPFPPILSTCTHIPLAHSEQHFPLALRVVLMVLGR